MKAIIWSWRINYLVDKAAVYPDGRWGAFLKLALGLVIRGIKQIDWSGNGMEKQTEVGLELRIAHPHRLTIKVSANWSHCFSMWGRSPCEHSIQYTGLNEVQVNHCFTWKNCEGPNMVWREEVKWEEWHFLQLYGKVWQKEEWLVETENDPRIHEYLQNAKRGRKDCLVVESYSPCLLTSLKTGTYSLVTNSWSLIEAASVLTEVLKFKYPAGTFAC